MKRAPKRSAAAILAAREAKAQKLLLLAKKAERQVAEARAKCAREERGRRDGFNAQVGAGLLHLAEHDDRARAVLTMINAQIGEAVSSTPVSAQPRSMVDPVQGAVEPFNPANEPVPNASAYTPETAHVGAHATSKQLDLISGATA